VWLSDSVIGYNNVVDHNQSSVHCAVMSTGEMSDHTEHQDRCKPMGGVYTCQFGCCQLTFFSVTY